jgi:hypothetical protein
MHASVTDCPYFIPAGPVAGISCRPSTRLLSIITPMINELVSSDSSWRAWFAGETLNTIEKKEKAYNVLCNLRLFGVLFQAVAVTAVDLWSHVSG